MARFLSLLLLLLTAGCAGRPVPAPEVFLQDTQIGTDAVWQKRVIIGGTVKVSRGATLTIRPGTEVVFLHRDLDGDGLGDASLLIEGALHAEGSRGQPILFHSAAADPHPGDWRGIHFVSSADVRLRWCEIADAASALWADSSRGTVEDCTLRHNLEGSRLEQATFLFRNCLIEENRDLGIAMRDSQVEIARSILRYNGAAIDLTLGGACLLHENNLYGNRLPLSPEDPLGNLQASGNWWGNTGPAEGAHAAQPAQQWVAGTGPRDALLLREAWRFSTDGFVDAGPAAGADAVFVPSWDGRLYALDSGGKLLWSRPLGDILEAKPVIDGGAVYVQSWQREVYALDCHDGREVWRFTYPPSAADDYIQGGLIDAGDLLLVPGWNGNLYALDKVDGARRWLAPAGEPLRVAPATDGERVYQASGAGLITAWSLAGKRLWRADSGAPLLAAPAITPQGPVAVTCDGILVAFDRHGRERWRRKLGEACFYGAPVYQNRALYLGTSEGTAVEAGSGQRPGNLAAAGDRPHPWHPTVDRWANLHRRQQRQPAGGRGRKRRAAGDLPKRRRNPRHTRHVRPITWYSVPAITASMPWI